MLAILKREFKSFFSSMIGWLYLAVNLFFAAWYFRFYGMLSGYPYVSYVLSGTLLIFLFSMPILTMRTLAEEMKQRTDQLLFTSPVPVWKIILGKYIALFLVFLIPVMIISLFPVIQMVYGEVPVAENYIGILGYLLFGAACLAIGLFLSSITENQIIAAVLTFFALLFGIMIPGICNLISPVGNVFTDILDAFNLAKSLDLFLYGVLYLPGILYYFSIIFITLYLANFTIQKRRWSISSHGISKVFSSIISIVLVILITICANVAVSMIPSDKVSIDLTYNSIYSLTNEAKQVLDELNNDVTIYYLVDESTIDNTIETTLKDIADYSEHIELKYISPTDNPSFYTTYSDENPSDNSCIIVGKDKYKVIDYFDCYEITYDYDYDIYTGQYVVSDYSVTGYDGEGRIISGISYVALEDIPKIYNIQGHDEMDITASLDTRLAKANVEVETINLLTYDDIPADADCIFVLGPLSDFSLEETDKINRYLEKGGNAVFVVAYTDASELDNYNSIFNKYNLKVEPGLVMEQGTSFYNSQQYYLLPDIVEHEITEGVYSSGRTKYVYMPYCKGLSLTDEYGDVDQDVFLKTTANAFLLTDITGETPESQYENNCYMLGVYATKYYNDTTSQIVVLTSDFMLEEEISAAVNGNNYTVFVNAMTLICGNDSSGVIPVKNYDYSQVLIDETMITIYSILLIIIIPLGFVITGLIIWWDRRKS